MPEILKHPNGQTNWTAIFAALGAMLVLVLQQWQSYQIAVIKTQAEVNKVNFLDKAEVYKIETELRTRIEKIEEKCNECSPTVD